MLEPVVVVEPMQFTLLLPPLQFTFESEGAFVGHNYSLGLDRALDIIKAIERGD